MSACANCHAVDERRCICKSLATEHEWVDRYERIKRLEARLLEVTEQRDRARRAQGELEATEWPDVVRAERERAERAEADCARLRDGINSALDSFTVGKKSEVFSKLTAVLGDPPTTGKDA